MVRDSAFILKLQGHNFFVGYCEEEKLHETLLYHFLGISEEWTKIHKPEFVAIQKSGECFGEIDTQRNEQLLKKYENETFSQNDIAIIDFNGTQNMGKSVDWLEFLWTIDLFLFYGVNKVRGYLWRALDYEVHPKLKTMIQLRGDVLKYYNRHPTFENMKDIKFDYIKEHITKLQKVFEEGPFKKT